MKPRREETVVKAPKRCKYCDEPLYQRGRQFHPECREPARQVAMANRIKCSRCKKFRAPSKFSSDSSRADGLFPWCKNCQNDATKAGARQKDGDELNGHICPLCDTPIRGHLNRRFCSSVCKNRVASLRKNFNMSVEQFRKLVKDTGGKCPICKNTPSRWNLDHNHKTGITTGVVCTRCNVGLLAYSDHDVSIASRLVDFLRETPASRLGVETKVSDKYATNSAGSSKLHATWEPRH